MSCPVSSSISRGFCSTEGPRSCPSMRPRSGFPMSQASIRRLRIGPRSAGMSMTPEEFDAVPPGRWDDRYRYELIRGVLVVAPIAGNAEVDPNEELGYLLRLYKD